MQRQSWVSVKMTKQEKKLEKRILALVKANEGTTVKIVSDLRTKDPSISESAARRMVWRLVDRGQLSLTQSRRLAAKK
jgi:hypothetical protein